MKITQLQAMAISCILLCISLPGKANTIMDTLTNKQRVLSFYKLIVGQRRAELIPEFVREDYIQHNPNVKQGRAGITDVINYLKTLPPPPEGGKSPIIRAIQEGDLVVTHLDIVFMGKRMVVIDVFKLKDGVLAEHWDAIQEMPDQTGMVVTATNGSNEVDKDASTVNSKAIVDRFYKAIRNRDSEMHSFIDKAYVEHDPVIINSGKNLASYLNDDPGRAIKIHRIIAEGDFVTVQSEFRKEDKSFAFYEIFRVEHSKIVEHWSVEQVIPDGVEPAAMF
ncbi:Predicted SnoaL-like aldol condensation-catalyzing enzyme [Mucilaginibacter sp. OK268]|uniref:nuclear transport factor 2 family protein n=1 Tax=Mucilaginibacter sp. OK268 TaxID=1881048 RepID=UPI000888288C|nr:nuclear transport factor 2 family protein [Mucilaginibacter sp. OK268]SDP75570.1 Predicted SnoaL-like aldol condensation-catalyzing enzyme [Mucilaginibacter sp. OK268]